VRQWATKWSRIAPGEENRIEERGPDRARIVRPKQHGVPARFQLPLFQRCRRPFTQRWTAKRRTWSKASSPWRSASLVGEWPGDAPRALIMHADPLSAYAYRWFDGVAPRPVIDKAFDRYWRHLRWPHAVRHDRRARARASRNRSPRAGLAA
jgi:alpha-1,6-mannosyltransferase